MASERQLSTILSEFALTMVTDYPIQGILERLVGRIVDMLPITAAGVTLIEPGTEPKYVAASDEAALRYERLQTELDEGPCLAAYRTGEAVAVADLAHDDRFKSFGPAAVAAGLGAVFTFPLRQGSRLLGALDLYRDTPGALDDPDMAAAQTLADVTAAYLVNAQGRDDLLIASERSYANSVHDALTGLPNRTLFLERLGHAQLRLGRSKKQVAVLFIDLDEFKSVNDLHGHSSGDALLKEVARRLSSLLRPSDTLARISGDEFVILCEDLDAAQQAEMIAKRIAAALAVPFDLSGAAVVISASVGIAFADAGEDAAEVVLDNSDAAMYQAKRKGGGRYQVIDHNERHLADYRTGLGRDLPHAIDRRELRVDYQPIVDTRSGRIVGAEALLRWDHPTRGLIAPIVMIPLAEQSAFITALGRWVLERACADRCRWSGRAGVDDFEVAVNVSAHQLMAPDFVAAVEEVLTSTATPPEIVTLEITESVFLHDSERALIVLTELKELGVKLALDDFGTGYSSLVYLDHFPIDVVKIDRAYTTKLSTHPATNHIVRSVIQLAHNLDMGVVVEGVETAEQRREVATLGGDSCQGFYFARPMAADNLDLLIQDAGTLLDLRLPTSSAVGEPRIPQPLSVRQ